MQNKIKSSQSESDVNNVSINAPAVKVGFLRTYQLCSENFLFKSKIMNNKAYLLCDSSRQEERGHNQPVTERCKTQSESATVRYSAAWWREYYKKNADRLRAYNRQYSKKCYKTHAERERSRRDRWHKKNPEKYAAQLKVGYAVSSGKLFKQPCSVCGSKNVNAHHEDYSKPLDVVWLCPVHHSERHMSLNKVILTLVGLVSTAALLLLGVQS